MNCCILPFVCLGLLTPWAAAQPPSEKEELERLQGKWICVGANLEGKKIGAAEATGLEIAFEVKGDRLFLFSKGKIKGTYSLKLGPHKSPREIDTVEVEGPAPGTKSRGIYALEGETLKLCLRDKLNGRPGTFTVAEGSDDMYWLLRRELPKVFVYQRSLAARMLGFAVSPVVQAAVVEGHKK